MFDALTRRSPRRRWSSVVLIGSFGLHAAAALAVMVWSMWKIEKLAPERMPVSIAWGGNQAVEVPPQQEPSKPPPPTTPTRHVARDTVQPTKAPPVEVLPDTTGGGDTTNPATGGGEPSTGGPSTGGPPCEGPCTGEVAQTVATPVCGDGQRGDGERCDDGNTVDGDGCSRQCQIEPPRRMEVPVRTIESLRISGEAQILPPSSVQSQMQRDGRDRVDALFRVCLDAAGQVSEVTLRKSTGFADYDARLSGGVRAWRYRPYSVDGRAVPVCGSVRFVYVQR